MIHYSWMKFKVTRNNKIKNKQPAKKFWKQMNFWSWKTSDQKLIINEKL